MRRIGRALQTSGDETVGPPTLPEPVSERELHVLRFLATELTGPQITRELCVSLNTLRTHSRHIFGKLNVHSRSVAVSHAAQLGLI